jgi:hypothetical protein
VFFSIHSFIYQVSSILDFSKSIRLAHIHGYRGSLFRIKGLQLYDVLNFSFQGYGGELFYFFGDGFWAFFGYGYRSVGTCMGKKGFLGTCMGKTWEGTASDGVNLGKRMDSYSEATDGILWKNSKRHAVVMYKVLKQAGYRGSFEHVLVPQCKL